MESRILQVLDTQRVRPSAIEFHIFMGALHVNLVVSADGNQATRIGQLIRRMERVLSVLWLPLTDSMDQIALSLGSDEERLPDTDPESEFWRPAPSICMRKSTSGQLVDGHETEVRLRWTKKNFYFLFICDYDELYLRNGAANVTQPTAQLWNWDVAEVFVGNFPDHLSRYCEFELSPRGEWLDLRIEYACGKIIGTQLDSGLVVASRIDESNTRWFGFMRVPCDSIAARSVAAGDRFRANFFRSQGKGPVELAWQATNQISFHVPAAFGHLILME